MNLKRRGMKIDSKCCLCNRLDEDGAHLFFKCKQVSPLWHMLQMENIRAHLASMQSAMEVIMEILKMKETIQRQVVVLMYVWWSERCAIREGDNPRSISYLCQLIISYAEECSSLKPTLRECALQKPKTSWKRPPVNYVKASCDGSFKPLNGTGGWGFVLRGDDGEVISAGYGKLKNVLDPHHAEIIACLQAVQRAAELGIQNLVLETDATMVVQAISMSELDRSSVSCLIWELKYLFNCNFASRVVIHTPRSCNLVAHELATAGSGLSPGSI